MVGIDLIPAQPPRGVTSIQGDFLSPQVRKLVRDVVVEQVRRKKQERALERRFEGKLRGKGEEAVVEGESVGEGDTGVVVQDRPSYIDLEKAAALDIEAVEAEKEDGGRMVDVSSLRWRREREKPWNNSPVFFHCLPIFANVGSPSGGDIRYVRTLAPDYRLHEQHTE